MPAWICLLAYSTSIGARHNAPPCVCYFEPTHFVAMCQCCVPAGCDDREMVRGRSVSHTDCRCTYYMGISVLSFMMLYLRDVVLPASGDEPIFGASIDKERRPLYYTCERASSISAT